ncbi:DUF2322 family protein [Neisseria polysaccharea]|uniref:DUF2322 family protein n=1 Tax=Neisseria polysaccharea TaxID=489 RepID=UPI00272A2329|nr:DUF2322 family protein [Neisseria polysaccharea]
MNFQDYLATFPSIDHLGGLDVQDADGKTVHHIPAVQGKLGSLKLYNALAERFGGKLGKEAAEQGLIWFAEHVADAHAHPGKHPNIDLLENVVQSGETWLLKPVSA